MSARACAKGCRRRCRRGVQAWGWVQEVHKAGWRQRMQLAPPPPPTSADHLTTPVSPIHRRQPRHASAGAARRAARGGGGGGGGAQAALLASPTTMPLHTRVGHPPAHTHSPIAPSPCVCAVDGSHHQGGGAGRVQGGCRWVGAAWGGGRCLPACQRTCRCVAPPCTRSSPTPHPNPPLRCEQLRRRRVRSVSVRPSARLRRRRSAWRSSGARMRGG